MGGPGAAHPTPLCCLGRAPVGWMVVGLGARVGGKLIYLVTTTWPGTPRAVEVIAHLVHWLN